MPQQAGLTVAGLVILSQLCRVARGYMTVLAGTTGPQRGGSCCAFLLSGTMWLCLSQVIP